MDTRRCGAVGSLGVEVGASLDGHLPHLAGGAGRDPMKHTRGNQMLVGPSVVQIPRSQRSQQLDG